MTSLTRPQPGYPPRVRPVRAALRAVACVAVLALAGLVAGCDLRQETPPPPVLVPDDAEVLRDRHAREAAALATAAQEATTTAEEAVAAPLALVAASSTEHVAALGGVYEPFPDVTATPTSTPTSPTAEPAPSTAADVLALLRASAEAARTDATTVTDPGMAHLLAAIALNRLLLADALSAALEGTTPELGEVTVPASLPAGMDPQAAAVLVQSEDAAGMAWEVVAARSADDARARAADRAALHRARAEAWAEAAEIAGTGTDPRRSAYDLPEAVTDATAPTELMWNALGEIESTLGESYAALVPTVAPEARAGLLDAALEAMRRAASLHVPVPPLPGMAEVDAD